jgi:sodium/proline symporter
VKNYIKIEGEYFYELLPGFIFAFIAIIVVSLITAKPSEETLQKLDQSQPDNYSPQVGGNQTASRNVTEIR